MSANTRPFKILQEGYIHQSVFVLPRHKINLESYNQKSSSTYIKALNRPWLLKFLIQWSSWASLRPSTRSSIHRTRNSTSVTTIGSCINSWCASDPPPSVWSWLKPYVTRSTLWREECSLMAHKDIRICTNRTFTACSESWRKRGIEASMLAGLLTLSAASPWPWFSSFYSRILDL